MGLWSWVFIGTVSVSVTAVICLYYRCKETSDSGFELVGAYDILRKEKLNLCDSYLEGNHLAKTESHMKWCFLTMKLWAGGSEEGSCMKK